MTLPKAVEGSETNQTDFPSAIPNAAGRNNSHWLQITWSDAAKASTSTA